MGTAAQTQLARGPAQGRTAAPEAAWSGRPRRRGRASTAAPEARGHLQPSQRPVLYSTCHQPWPSPPGRTRHGGQPCRGPGREMGGAGPVLEERLAVSRPSARTLHSDRLGLSEATAEATGNTCGTGGWLCRVPPVTDGVSRWRLQPLRAPPPASSFLGPQPEPGFLRVRGLVTCCKPSPGR